VDDDSPKARRESMINILGSWDLEEYAAGGITIEQAIEKMDQVPLPSGRDAG
jgi:hypothetical protein